MTQSPPERRCVSGADPDAPYQPREGVGEFWEAPDLEQLAYKLRDTKFPGFPDCVVRYVWKAKGTKDAIGKCIKASGLVGYFGEADYVIWLAYDTCVGFTHWQVEALLFHELCHVGVEGEDGEKLTVVRHDFEGFTREIEHYGFWQSDVRAIARAVQSRLPFEDTAEPVSIRIADDAENLPSLDEVMAAANEHMSEDPTEE